MAGVDRSDDEIEDGMEMEEAGEGTYRNQSAIVNFQQINYEGRHKTELNFFVEWCFFESEYG